MIGDSLVRGVPVRSFYLAFWFIRAQTIEIALIQYGLLDSPFWLSVALQHDYPVTPSYLENIPH